DIGRPQKPFIDVADRITDSILDAGCGTGENALFFASRGHKVTGIDFIEEAINRAKRKAAEQGLSATFLVMDALALQDLPEVFDSVIDSGLFHVFSDEDRKRYVEGLATVLKPGGRLFAKSSAPVQTERTSSASWDRALIHSISAALCISRRVP